MPENRIVTRRFDGNYEVLSRMILESWKGQHGPFYDFTPAFLKWILSSPQIDQRFTFGCYVQQRLIGFILAVQKKVRVRDEELLICIPTLLSVRRGAEKHVPGIRILEYLGENLKQCGYQAFVGFGENKPAVKSFIRHFTKFKSYDLKEFKLIQFLVKRLDIPQAGPAEKANGMVFRQPEGQADVKQCMDLLNRIEGVSLSQIWDEAGMAYYMEGPYRFSCVYESGGLIKGVLNGLIVNMHGAAGLKMTATLENIYFDGMNAREISGLIAHTIEHLKERKALVIMIPDTGYFDIKPFLDNGFMKSFGGVTANLWGPKTGLCDKVDDRFYLEVV